MTSDPHADLRDRVYRTVFDGPGRTDSALRHGVAANAAVPAELAALIEKIHRHAYKVTDEDLARLRGSHGDDELFEIVVSAALGASRNRLAAGLAALEDA